MHNNDNENLSDFTCVQCKDKYNEPRLLPCGGQFEKFYYKFFSK